MGNYWGKNSKKLSARPNYGGFKKNTLLFEYERRLVTQDCIINNLIKIIEDTGCATKSDLKKIYDLMEQ